MRRHSFPIDGSIHGQTLQPHGWSAGRSTTIVSNQTHLHLDVRLAQSWDRRLFHLSNRNLAASNPTARLSIHLHLIVLVLDWFLLRTESGRLAHAAEPLRSVRNFCRRDLARY